MHEWTVRKLCVCVHFLFFARYFRFDSAPASVWTSACVRARALAWVSAMAPHGWNAHRPRACMHAFVRAFVRGAFSRWAIDWLWRFTGPNQSVISV